MRVEYLQSKKLSISENCFNNVPTNTVSHNCQHCLTDALRTHVSASSTVTSADTRPRVKQKYLLQVCETLLVSYNVIAISKPHRTRRIQLRCDIFRTCLLMIQRDIILSDTSDLSLPVGSLIVHTKRSKLGRPPTRALLERICESVDIRQLWFTSCMKHDADLETRRNFVNWQLQRLHPQVFRVQAWFNLNGWLNSQSDRNWRAENLVLTHEIP
jgi:hypothetical protein